MTRGMSLTSAGGHVLFQGQCLTPCEYGMVAAVTHLARRSSIRTAITSGIGQMAAKRKWIIWLPCVVFTTVYYTKGNIESIEMNLTMSSQTAETKSSALRSTPSFLESPMPRIALIRTLTKTQQHLNGVEKVCIVNKHCSACFSWNEKEQSNLWHDAGFIFRS
jgi:hypothetical protein